VYVLKLLSRISEIGRTHESNGGVLDLCARITRVFPQQHFVFVPLLRLCVSGLRFKLKYKVNVPLKR